MAAIINYSELIMKTNKQCYVMIKARREREKTVMTLKMSKVKNTSKNKIIFPISCHKID
jgi:hypothetical protein